MPDHPRIRGEHSPSPTCTPCPGGSSPHTRGARLGGPRTTPRGRIIPAYAGSTAPKPTTPAVMPDHPRIRGEHSRHSAIVGTVVGSSPHTRGAPDGAVSYVTESRIIPAYAGSTCETTEESSPEPDHPRIRGEHTYANMEQESILGSSPHTRGALECGGEGVDGVWIIPAYAGST